MSSGHYTAICNHTYIDKWIEFDDKSVSIMPNSKFIPKDDGYILFYRKN